MDKSNVFTLWLRLASIYASLSLGYWIGSFFFSGSTVPFLIGMVFCCAINWNSHKHFSGSRRSEENVQG
ncbi:hypothetical protein [Candidatus Pantoea multigeneris]|uniref:Uncharacterized protein n=1 Tax=Candidatus Pantoea multigeneris TaxID=2608357 RepID=A0ABX0REL7_9GAMM|nr:hypothetical protein [Pantoea multigeneris]NIF23068.1 hypothetical protein [Pantoea multigeneris]